MLVIASVASAQEAKPAYRDPAVSIDKRVDDLVGRMTLEDKAGQLVSNTKAVPRLGAPAYNLWSEALHGVANTGGVTVFPQAIGLGATFDARSSRRGLTQIHLKAGEAQTVKFALSGRDLSHVGEAGNRLIGAGSYSLTIGGGQPGTKAAVATTPFEIKGAKGQPR